MPIIQEYTIAITDKQTIISLPGFSGRSSLVHFGFQGDKLCLWALVDPNQQSIPIEISLFGTGQKIDSRLLYPRNSYLATVLDTKGIAWHIFWSVDPCLFDMDVVQY